MAQKKNMLKESKQVETLAQSYHGSSWDGQSYAFEGYKKNLYYTSDRYIELDENFKPLDGKTILKGYGLEIETDCGWNINDDMKAHFINDTIVKNSGLDDKLFKYQHDGSITGIECITQVMTKERIRNDYSKWMSFYDGLSKYSLLPGLRCGMHVNISNAVFGTTQDKQEEAIKKLVYLMQKNYNLLARLFNRDLNRTGYCANFYEDFSIDFLKNTKIRDIRVLNSNDHGKMFNGSHFNVGRVEIRLVGPQTRFEEFRNTMESVFHLVERAKEISWKDVTKLDVWFKGCNAHVLDRLSRCRNEGYLTTEMYETIKSTSTDVKYYQRAR